MTKSSPNDYNNSKLIDQRYQSLVNIKNDDNEEISQIDFYYLENFRSRYKLNQMKTEKNEFIFKKKLQDLSTDDSLLSDDINVQDNLNSSFHNYTTLYKLDKVPKKFRTKRIKSFKSTERDKNEDLQYRLYKNELKKI